MTTTNESRPALARGTAGTSSVLVSGQPEVSAGPSRSATPAMGSCLLTSDEFAAIVARLACLMTDAELGDLIDILAPFLAPLTDDEITELAVRYELGETGRRR